MNTHRASPRVAVVGSGISGLTAAYVLRDSCDVTVFEADNRLGGHAHTHTVADGSANHRVDSGFIVHNDRTYPHVRRLFAELGIDVRECEMSMSVHCDGCGLEYAGGRGLRGVFAQKRRLFDRKYLSMLMSVKRFHKAALAHLDHPTDPQLTYGQFLAGQNFSAYFVSHYAIPIVACVWSSGDAEALGYPAGHLFEFLKHHGFLQLKGSPQWLTVVGGSGSYIDKVVATIGDVRKGLAATSISRESDGVHVVDSQGATHTFDRVVIATHADQALTLLADPTQQEKDILGAFGYSVNETVLHRDGSLLPDAKGARSAWNYHLADCHTSSPRTTVTYWMNRLQGITSSKPFLVTLNAAGAVAAADVVSIMRYTHPIFDTASVAVQPQLKTLFTDQTVYAGAYHGWGFHEDGCRSGVQAAAAWGVEWE